MLFKPTRGLRLNKSHPLARGLVGCWLCNEGTGGTVFDLSRNGNIGTLQDNTSWTAGKFGMGLTFDDSGDYVNCAANETLDVRTTPFTLVTWLKYNSGSPTTHTIYEGLYTKPNWLIADASNTTRLTLRKADDSGVDYYFGTSGIFAANTWWNLAVTYDKQNVKHYVNGVFDTGSPRTGIMGGTAPTSYRIGGRPPDGFNGVIDNFMVFNRALTAQEIALLYREPFCIFDRRIRPELIGGQIVNLAGTSAALSSLSATAKATRKVSGTVAGISDVEALLNSIRDRLETERSWLRETLFNGMTANAFKLGTTLSLGWFWVRIAGCSVLYRGSSMGEIDFVNILAVAESEACKISPPSYISHNSNSTYFYVIRRLNNSGYQEHTLTAAVKVSIDSNGNLAEPQPNKVFDSAAELVDGNKIQLVWFYCPLAQKSQPVCFNVYYDDRTGQINYQNPLATIGYKGRKFYSHQTSALEAGKYLFAIRPEDASDIESSSLARLRIQLDTTSLDASNILRAEAV